MQKILVFGSSLDEFRRAALQKGLAKNAAKLSVLLKNIRDQIGHTLEAPDRIFREKYLALLESDSRRVGAGLNDSLKFANYQNKRSY